MVPKDADNRYDDLLSGGVPAAQGEFSLEEILAEYGAGEEQRLLRGTEAEDPPPTPPGRPDGSRRLPGAGKTEG